MVVGREENGGLTNLGAGGHQNLAGYVLGGRRGGGLKG
jgi:hypothetical protein